MTFGNKLRAARKNKQLTQKELAAKIKAAHNSISNWENDQNMPDPDTIQHLCWALDVQPNYFFDVETNPSYPSNIIPMPEMRQIPLIGSIACGKPILAEEHVAAYIDIPKHIKADFALTCKGDSMINARIYDGDIVYVRTQTSVETGEIAAVLIDNEATLKRFYHYPEKNMLILKAENPKYEDFIFIGPEIQNLRILGKAVAFTGAI